MCQRQLIRNCLSVFVQRYLVRTVRTKKVVGRLVYSMPHIYIPALYTYRRPIMKYITQLELVSRKGKEKKEMQLEARMMQNVYSSIAHSNDLLQLQSYSRGFKDGRRSQLAASKWTRQLMSHDDIRCGRGKNAWQVSNALQRLPLQNQQILRRPIYSS